MTETIVLMYRQMFSEILCLSYLVVSCSLFQQLQLKVLLFYLLLFCLFVCLLHEAFLYS